MDDMYCPLCGQTLKLTRYLSREHEILKATIENFLAECPCSPMFTIFLRRVMGTLRAFYLIDKHSIEGVWQGNA